MSKTFVRSIFFKYNNQQINGSTVDGPRMGNVSAPYFTYFSKKSRMVSLK